MHNREKLEPPDISEKGGLKGGAPQRSDERLFMQLLVFGLQGMGNIECHGVDLRLFNVRPWCDTPGLLR